jgi:hypothetical protein
MSDGGGLFLLAAKVSGRRHAWRLDYTFERTRTTLSLGVYPKVDLQLARKKAREIHRLVARDIDPSAQRKEKSRFCRSTRCRTPRTQRRGAQELLRGRRAPLVRNPERRLDGLLRLEGDSPARAPCVPVHRPATDRLDRAIRDP